MATSYTSLLGLALPVTGELAGTWGDTVNNSITSLLDTAVAGTTTLSTDADVTLSTTTGASNQARQAILLCSGARSALRTITAPAQSKIYAVVNNTTGGFAVKIVGAGPTTGVTVANGKTAIVIWNGADFVEVAPATATTATNLAGGAAGSVPYQSGASTTTFLSIGTAAQVLQVNAGATAPEWVSSTGTGNVVRATSPTLVTPLLGTPTSGTLTNCTGLPVATGISGLGANVATFLATPSSANLAAAVTDETGTGALVFGTSPTITTPTFTTSATFPLHIGGTGTTSTLTLRSTSGVGTTGADIIFQTGNNGATEAMRILNSGNVGIGTASPTSKLTVDGTFNATGNVTLGDATTDTVTVSGYGAVGTPNSAIMWRLTGSGGFGGTTQVGFGASQTGTSAGTTALIGYSSALTTATASYTIANVYNYNAVDVTKGAGSTITNQHGVNIADQTQGTNNFGITSLVSSGTNKWNLYASGTAANYFAGNVQFAAGAAATPSITRFSDDNTGFWFPAADTIAASTAGSERARFTATGFGIGTTSPAVAFVVSNAGAEGVEVSATGGLAQITAFNRSTSAYATQRITCASFVVQTGTSPATFFQIDASGAVTVTSTGTFAVTGSGTLGYGTGSGGTVTQATSRTTGVTLDKTNGAITLVSAAGTATWQSFTVTNNKVAATDTVIVNQKSGTDLYMIHVTNVAAGSFRITFATTGGTTTEQPVFSFAVIKAVTS